MAFFVSSCMVFANTFKATVLPKLKELMENEEKELFIKMKTISKLCLSCFVFVLVLVGCSQNSEVSNKSEMVDIRPLGEDEIEDYIQEYDMNLAGVDVIYDQVTIIMYKTDYISGYHEVFKNDDQIISGNSLEWRAQGNIDYYRPTGGTAIGDYPHVVIFFGEKVPLDEGYLFKVIGKEGASEIVVTQRAHAIETRGLGDVQDYELLTGQGQVVGEE